MVYVYFDERRACSVTGRPLRAVRPLKTRSMVATLALGFVIHAVALLPAEARGGGLGGGRAYSGFGSRGAHFAAGRRYGNDEYIKASSNNLDKLLATKLKNICRGC